MLILLDIVTEGAVNTPPVPPITRTVVPDIAPPTVHPPLQVN